VASYKRSNGFNTVRGRVFVTQSWVITRGTFVTPRPVFLILIIRTSYFLLFIDVTYTIATPSKPLVTTTTTTGGGQRRLRLRRGPISFFWTRCSREKNLLIPAAAGSSPSMQHLGLLATRRRLGRRVDFFSPCAQLLWCELYVFRILKKKYAACTLLELEGS